MKTTDSNYQDTVSFIIHCLLFSISLQSIILIFQTLTEFFFTILKSLSKRFTKTRNLLF